MALSGGNDDTSEEMQFMAAEFTSIQETSNIFGEINLGNTSKPTASSNSQMADIENPSSSKQNVASRTVADLINSSSHPKVSFFHLFFKAIGLFFYILGGWFVTNYVSWFVPCLLSISIDFWITKNVSGRLLVGLRWWSEINDNGDSVWRFENKALKDNNGEEVVNNSDYRIFWYSMYLNGIIWGVFFIWNVLKMNLSSLLIITIALSLQWSNIVGYWKCHKDMEQKLESNINSFITNSAFSMFRNGIFSGGGAASST